MKKVYEWMKKSDRAEGMKTIFVHLVNHLVFIAFKGKQTGHNFMSSSKFLLHLRQSFVCGWHKES